MATGLTTRDYETALDVQDACNGQALVNELSRIMARMPPGTDAKNRHPIVQLFVAKLADLAGLEHTYPIDAERACEHGRCGALPEEGAS